jgi:hypothetical protein
MKTSTASAVLPCTPDTFSIEARIFGLGSLIESTIEKELQRARAKEHAFLPRWLERQGV